MTTIENDKKKLLSEMLEKERERDLREMKMSKTIAGLENLLSNFVRNDTQSSQEATPLLP